MGGGGQFGGGGGFMSLPPELVPGDQGIQIKNAPVKKKPVK
jgi:hypothetical protein